MDASRRSSDFLHAAAGKVAVLYPACWCRRQSLLALMEFADGGPHLNIELEVHVPYQVSSVPVLPVLPSCVDRLRSLRNRFQTLAMREVHVAAALNAAGS